jgi:hypothetical protein
LSSRRIRERSRLTGSLAERKGGDMDRDIAEKQKVITYSVDVYIMLGLITLFAYFSLKFVVIRVRAAIAAATCVVQMPIPVIAPMTINVWTVRSTALPNLYRLWCQSCCRTMCSSRS